MTWLADDLDGGVFPRLDALAALADIDVVGETRCAGEDAAGVDAVELAGLGGGVEELGEGHAVDGEVVDGFVGLGWVCERGGGDHGVDGFGVWERKGFFLCEESFFSFLVDRWWVCILFTGLLCIREL